jgi:hypothetical protein
VATFKIDPDKGVPDFTRSVWEVPSPTCVLPFQI